MFDMEQFYELSKATRDFIIEASIREANDGVAQNHSISTICRQKREIAIAARMTSKPFNWNIINNNNGVLQMTGLSKKYTGKDIADIVVQSCRTYGKTYYPVTGDWTNVGIKQLVLFVKSDKYHAYARFKVNSIQAKSVMTDAELSNVVDPTPIANYVYKSVLEMELINEDANDIPQDYVGNKSSLSIYDLAFKGPSPNIMII